MFTGFKSLYQRSLLFKLFVWLVFIIPGVPFIIVNIGFAAYVFWPRNYDTALAQLMIPAESNHVVISAHGVKDSPASWSDKVQRLMTANNPFYASLSLDWQAFSDNPFICSVMGKRIGSAIGEAIAKNEQITSVHAIGHSCGSFVVYGICNTIKSLAPAIRLQTTYLDPVSIYAGYGWDYGVNHFGDCADYSEAYIDTGDGVPGSNQPLIHAHTFDVTEARINSQSTEPPHNWPTHFYLQSLKESGVPFLNGDESDLLKRYPPGQLTKLDSVSKSNFKINR